MKKSALIIGSGFGGIASALRLRALGYNVSIYEKLDQIGGRARVFKKNGFTFDAGPTVITAPFLFDELFSLFGKNRKDYTKFVPLDPWYRFYFQDGKVFNYGGTVEDTENEIKKFSQIDVKGYKKLLNMSEKIFDVGFTKLSHTPFHSFLFMIKQIPTLIKLQSYLTVYKLVSKYIKNDYIRQAFSIQPLLLGGNPFSTTSIYSLIHFLERKWGVHYAMGGTGALINGFKKLMKEEKIIINTNCEVKKIIIQNNEAKGIQLKNNKIINSDIIVSNIDPAYMYSKMIDSQIKRKWSEKKIKKLDFSMGLFVIFFGTKKIYESVAHHTIWMGNRYESLLNDIFKKKILAKDFSLYLHRPTATDSSMAPNGCDCFYVLSPVPNLKSSINWEKESENYKNSILKALEKTILPNLTQNISTCFYMNPIDFKNDYLAENGSGFSVAPIFTQSAWFRFNNKSENFKNLYLVGAGTHPGAGVPGVISSAKVLENLIISKDDK